MGILQCSQSVHLSQTASVTSSTKFLPRCKGISQPQRPGKANDRLPTHSGRVAILLPKRAVEAWEQGHEERDTEGIRDTVGNTGYKPNSAGQTATPALHAYAGAVSPEGQPLQLHCHLHTHLSWAGYSQRLNQRPSAFLMLKSFTTVPPIK